MLIYISGAISSDPDYKRKFADAEKVLTKKGHDVINPAFVASVLPHLEHEQYLHIDKALIGISDAVYFLKDWGTSKGAREEYDAVKYHNEVAQGVKRLCDGKWISCDQIKLIFEGENEDEI